MRIAIVSDTHFYAPGRGKDGIFWNRTLQSETDRIGRCLVDAVAQLEPDAAIHCGDITGACDMESWQTALETLDRLPCPWYAVLGNHDTWYPGVRDAFSARFGLPRGQTWHSVRLGGVRFVLLDTCWWEDVDGSMSPYLDRARHDAGQIRGLCVPEEEVDWLAGALQACRNEPVVIVSHAPLGFRERYPLATFPDGRPGPPGGCPIGRPPSEGGLMGELADRDRLRAMLADHPNVRLALAGHWHIFDRCDGDGITFVQTGAMREYPFEFRLLDIEDGVASVTTHGLADPSYAERSRIADRDNGWVAGTEAERTFKVDLGGTSG